MCCIRMAILLACIAQVPAQQTAASDGMDRLADRLVDKLVDKLSDRMNTASSLHSADMDGTTLGKTAALAAPQPRAVGVAPRMGMPLGIGGVPMIGGSAV